MNRRVHMGWVLAGVLVVSAACRREAAFGRSSLPFGSVDLPAPKATVRGTFQIAGWVLADQPIQEVSVYIDGKYLTATSTKMPRPDVALAKPGYKDARDCGFTLLVETSAYSAGWHEIVVQARAEDGATRDLATVPVFVQR